MGTAIVKAESRADGHRAYVVRAGGVSLAVDLYPGDEAAGERPWHADIRFVEAEQDLTGGDVSPRSAFQAAVSRHQTMVRGGRPMPVVAWAEVAQALEEAGAFSHAPHGR
jgi:hypothetical protein